MSNLIDTPNSPSSNIFQNLRNLHKQQKEYAIGDEMVQPFPETEEIEKFLNGEGRYLNNTNLICILILLVGFFLIYKFL